MSLIRKPLTQAIIPLLSRPLPRGNFSNSGTVVRWTPSTRGEDTNWQYVWGLYSYREPCNPLSNEKRECVRLRYAEAHMLISTHIHDFCGGLLAASAGVKRQGDDSYWGNNHIGLWGGCTLDSRVPDHMAVIPSVHDYLPESVTTLTFEQVQKLLSRSIMHAAFSHMHGYRRTGLLAFDRAEHDTQTRNVFKAGRKLKTIYNTAHTWPDWATPDTLAGILNGTKHLDDVRPRRLRRCPSELSVTMEFHEGWNYRNRNSSNQVGPFQFSMVVNDEGYDGDEDEDEYTDLEECTCDDCTAERERKQLAAPLVPKIAQVVSEATLAAWDSPLYLASAPTRMFNNG